MLALISQIENSARFPSNVAAAAAAGFETTRLRLEIHVLRGSRGGRSKTKQI
jgi:hypothetical protein